MAQTETTELAPAETVLPASFAQQRMWFLERFEGGAVYNVPVATRLRGPLDVDALERALGAVVERHESLRTVFALIDGVPHQVIRPPHPFSLQVIDVSSAPDAAEHALTIASDQALAPFDLAVDEPFRVALIKLDDEEYVLSLTLHHIATDAWSMGVLNRELVALYAGFTAGKSVELPELEIQYGDYAVWQRQWMASGGLDSQLDYWRAQLAGAPALLELPTDHPRPSRQSFRGATSRVVLPVELREQARAVGKSEGATMFMTLLAAFAALLSRYSDQEDVVVATPVANRGRTEFEQVVGLFVNTLPLRIELAGEPSFRDLLRRVREVALGAFSNQDMPFEKLVEMLARERHLSHAPLAQVMFVMQSSVERPATFPGVRQERVLTERGTAKFDLTFFATETPEGLRLSLEYCTDLFEESTALRMLEHYRVLLEAAVADPSLPVSELRLLGEDETRLVLEEWTETARRYPGDLERPVHELVTAQASRTPHALAVEFLEKELTYAELEERSNRLARHLRTLGVRPGSVVGLCAERSVELMVGVLGVLKAGGAYAPIDPGYPEERIAFMLADTETPVLLTQLHLLDRLPAHQARTLCLDGDWAESDAHDEVPPEGAAALGDLAYVIYTSGSTGRPKGVAMAHRPLANLLAWQLECWSGQPPARTLQFASLSFDVAFQELFSTWCSGGTLILVDDRARRDPEALLRLLAEQRVERLFVPFVALQNLCEAADYLGVTLPMLREVITAGEQLKATDAIRRFFTRHPGCALVNQYGPTESHVATAYALTGSAEEWPALPPIGRPIANAKVYLLDRHRQPVPIGVPGELCIGGVSLARGYLGRPELTDERFVGDPFSADAGARAYRTGDLARYRPDGEIEYLGRADHQVKIRGFRVEPGEIEAALRAHAAVREALVVAREDGGEKRLVAHLVADRASVAPSELREHLRRSLPEYMIPSAFAFLDAFPLSPNGKIDRAQLALLPLSEEERAHTLTPPRNETERQLVAIWKKVLAVEQVGIHDDFFELGGHSLMAVRVFAEIERRLGTRVPLSELFESATIAELAEAIEFERAETSAWSSPIRLRPGRNGQAPLFLVGWAGGEVLGYRDLVESLDADIPVFGLRAPGVDRRRAPLASVEELATHYVEEIRSVQPHGPYHLAGFCFSGLIAYEMARQLGSEGESTGTLALIDTYPYRGARRRRLLKAGALQLRAFREADRGGRREWLRRRIVGVKGRIHYAVHFRVGPRIYGRLVARGLQHLAPHRPWNLVLVASNLAWHRYVPTPLDARVLFFRPERAPDSRPTPWDDLATAGVDLRQVVSPDINHERMMHRPHVSVVARELIRSLNDGTGAAEGSDRGAPGDS